MHMYVIIASFTVLLLIFIVDSVHSIKCYSCLSGTDPDCGSTDKDVLKKHQVDCDVASGHAAVGGHILTRCAKGLQEGEVTRSCSPVVSFAKDHACIVPKPGTTLCLCDTDYCNGSQTPASFAAGTILSVLACLLTRWVF